jgi:hypothetical protein
VRRISRTFFISQKLKMETNPPRKQFEFTYTVTDEQILEHRQRSMLEVFEWLSSTLDFIYLMQTPEERKRWQEIRNGEWEEDTPP